MDTVRINSVVTIEESSNGVLQITLEDRNSKNQFTSEIIEGLLSAYRYVGESPTCKVVIITGFDSYFSSGGTKESLLLLNGTRGNFSEVNIYSLPLECPVPVISAMQGHAIGGGFVMGIFSDLVILSRESYYTLNFMKYGFTPGMGSTLVVPKKLGVNLGNEMLISAKQYRGDELEKRGVAFEVLPRKQVLARAHELASLMAQKPLESLRLLKQHLSKDISSLLPAFVEQELLMHSKTMHKPEVANNIEQLFGNPTLKEADHRIKGMLESLKNGEISSTEAGKLIVNGGYDAGKESADTNNSSAAARRALSQYSSSDIAIISVAGRFPASNSAEEYWENIKQGRDCISDIPGSRNLLDEKSNGIVKCLWGGFINDVDRFDPLFFKISPREAQLMDPQERLLLQEVWNLLESVGYTRKKIAKQYDNKVAVYTGSMYQQYHAFDTDLDRKAMVAMSSLSSIANRISHFFNFNGPSMAVDTMCSAAASAVHLACQSLIYGQVRLAVVGAANLSIHPYKYHALTQSQLLSSQRENRGFSGSNGFIPAESVGAVLLKPLSDAVADGDDVLAVIKNSSISHKGNTDGFSVSNSDAVSELMRDCMRKANICPEEVNYVETSVAGSEVSDIAEMKALKNVFGGVGGVGKIPIGTVKSTIGHAEAASGLTQIIKVAMQMKHKALAPTINFKPVNPRLEIDDNLFYINDTAKPWDIDDGTGPRRAIINTLGAGGTNSCILLEEYQNCDSIDQQQQDNKSSRVAMFSAKTLERLKKLIEGNVRYLKSSQKVDFEQLVYTLQECREAMPARLSCVVSNLEELLDYLDSWLKGKYEGNTFYNDLDNESEGMKQGSEASPNEGLARMAKLWVLGEDLEWSSLYPHEKTQRPRKIVQLPTYPFLRRRCWLPIMDSKNREFALADGKVADCIGGKISEEDCPELMNMNARKKNEDKKSNLECVPRTPGLASLEEMVVQSICEILDVSVDEIKVVTPLKELGVTSVTKMLIVSAISDKIDVLNESNLGAVVAQLDTVEGIVSHIEEALSAIPEDKTPTPLADKTLLSTISDNA